MNWMKLDYTTDDKMWRGEREAGRKGASFDFFLPTLESRRTSESEHSVLKRRLKLIQNDKAA